MTMTVNQGIRYDAIDPINGMPSPGGFRRLIQIVFGLPIAFAASSFFLTFFQSGGGALVSWNRLRPSPASPRRSIAR